MTNHIANLPLRCGAESRAKLLERYKDQVQLLCQTIGAEQDGDVELTLRSSGDELPDVTVSIRLHLNDVPIWDEAEGQLEDILAALRKARPKLEAMRKI